MKNYIKINDTHYCVSSILSWRARTDSDGSNHVIIFTPSGFVDLPISEDEFVIKMEHAMEDSDAEKFNRGVRKMTEALERFVMRIPTSIRAHF